MIFSGTHKTRNSVVAIIKKLEEQDKITRKIEAI